MTTSLDGWKMSPPCGCVLVRFADIDRSSQLIYCPHWVVSASVTLTRTTSNDSSLGWDVTMHPRPSTTSSASSAAPSSTPSGKDS